MWSGGPVLGKVLLDVLCISPQIFYQILLCSPHCSQPCHISTNRCCLFCTLYSPNLRCYNYVLVCSDSLEVGVDAIPTTNIFILLHNPCTYG